MQAARGAAQQVAKAVSQFFGLFLDLGRPISLAHHSNRLAKFLIMLKLSRSLLLKLLTSKTMSMIIPSARRVRNANLSLYQTARLPGRLETSSDRRYTNPRSAEQKIAERSLGPPRRNYRVTDSSENGDSEFLRPCHDMSVNTGNARTWESLHHQIHVIRIWVLRPSI